MLRTTSFLFGLVSLLVALSLAFYIWLPDLGVASNLARIVQASVTSVAILAGGIFAGVKLQLFREFAPHITITQTLTHRSISDSYFHIFVTATLHNSSKVRVDFRRGYFRLQAISPSSDEEIERLYADVFVDHNNRDFQWPTIDEAPREWSRNDLIVEPGESHQETCEFIVATGIRTVLVDTYMYNSKRPAVPQGWGTTSTHDIINVNN